MIGGQRSSLGRQVCRLLYAVEAGTMTDRQLLERFVVDADELAFAALVRRHGPMVLNVCRRVLHNPHDAEDAFQATFLVLLRRSEAIAQPELLGNWLYGVAYRTAKEARTRSARRRAREQQAAQRRADETEPAGWDDVRPVLDEELSRLPDKYRVPVVLCDLQSRSRKEVAEQIGLPEGTLSSRLARARDILRQRLRRRGLALSAGALATGLTESAAAASLPAPLVASTVQAVLTGSLAEAVAAGLVAAPVVSLVEGVLPSMLPSKLKMVAMVLVALSMTGAGTSALVHQAVANKPVPAAEAIFRTDAHEREKKDGEQKTEGRQDQREGERREAPVVRGVVKAVDPAKNTVTVTVQREGEKADHTVPVPREARIILLTKEGATLADLKPQMNVAVQLSLDEKSVVAIREIQTDRERGEREGDERTATVAGVVKALDAANNTITITIHRDGQQPMDQTLPLAKEARFVVSGNERAQLADLKPGMRAQLRLSENRRQVVLVLVNANRERELAGDRRERERPRIVGTFKAVAADKNQITITIRGEGRDSDRTLPLGREVKVALGRRENAQLTDIAPGRRVMLTLADDRQTVIAVQEFRGDEERGGERRRAEQPIPQLNAQLKSVDAGKQTITVTVRRGEEGETEMTLPVSRDARIATLAKEVAQLSDLVPASRVILILGGDNKTVILIKEVKKLD